MILHHLSRTYILLLYCFTKTFLTIDKAVFICTTFEESRLFCMFLQVSSVPGYVVVRFFTFFEFVSELMVLKLF